MGNSSSASAQRRSSSSRNSSGDECQICLGQAAATGGVAIMSPGCCGKFFHQQCVHDLINNNITTCPNCRANFSVDLITAARAARANAPAPQIPQQLQQQQLPMPPPQQQARNFFGNSKPPRNQNNSSIGSLFTASSRKNAVKGSAEEDELDLAAKPTRKAVKNVDGPSEEPTISIAAIPERNEIGLAAQSEFYVNVNLRASDVAATDAAATRLPMDVVCVLDNSGSMQGSKIDSLRVAMKFIRSQLRETDRLAVVSFNSSAEVVHGLLRMDAAKKHQSDEFCDAIQAGGGTCIYSGMREGVNILDARRTHNTLSCVFLLTDGQDGSNREQKRELGRSMRAKGYTLSVFGFGADHDAAQLQEIANAAEATFSYVEADDMVTDAFGGAIGGAAGTVATNMQVSLRVPSLAQLTAGSSSSATAAVGVSIVTTNAGRYPCARQPDGSYQVSYANMFAGEQRDVVVVLSLPTAGAGLCPVLLASATYATVDGAQRQAVPRLTAGDNSPAPYASTLPTDVNTVVCSLTRGDAPSTAVNMEVDVQINRVKALQAMQAAMAMADQGDYLQSNAVLKKAVNEIKSSPAFAMKSPTAQSAVDDLEEAMQNTSSSMEWNSNGGKATMCENYTSHNAQRKMYNKASKAYNPYQNVTSCAMQSSANNFKSSSGSGSGFSFF